METMMAKKMMRAMHTTSELCLECCPGNIDTSRGGYIYIYKDEELTNARSSRHV